MTLRYRLHYAPDNASLIIRLALDELCQPYETVLVDRAQKAQLSDSYRALNPAGRIPTLETPQGPISETAAHFDISPYPTLTAMCARLETRESVARLQVAEGMSARPFTAPQPPNPPEGVAK